MILVSEFMDDAAVELMRRHRDTRYEPGLADRARELARAVASAEALIVRNRTRVTADLLDDASHLKCVGRLGVGLDNIDVAACRKRGIPVFPATGANDLSVAEYVITTALMLTRKAYLSGADMLAGNWPRQHCAGGEISGKTIGMIGFGSIGRHVAKLARKLDMTTVAFDPFLPPDHPAWQLAGRRDLDCLLAECDVVSMHVPLSPSTHNLVDGRRLELMKPQAVLINTSRGGIVDEDAIAAALVAGRIGGAALDVFEDEPLNRASAERFRGAPNLVLTPHIAGVTRESNSRVSMMIAEKVLAQLQDSK